MNGDSLIIIRPDRNEIMFTTYREDYWEELSAQTWRLNSQGYPTCSKLGDLHRYIVAKWYGEDTLEEFTENGYVVDHLDNIHYNCKVSNLEFLKKDFNTAKGQWLDKQVKELEHQYALAIYKDFITEWQGFGPAYPLALFLAQEKNEKNIHPPQGPSLYGGDAT